MSRTSKRKRRQSTPKPTQPQQPRPQAARVPELPELVVPEVVYEPSVPFGDVEDYEVGLADERQLTLLMKDWRKGRATRTVWDMITDGYVTIFSLVVIVAMVVSGIMSVQQSAAGCTDVGCVTARGLLPWMALAGSVLVALTVSRIFGPVIASAAEGFWLLDAPVRRAKLLNRRLWGVVIGAGLIGFLLGGLITTLTGLDLTGVLIWAGALGAAAAAAVTFAAAEQSAERTAILAAVQAVTGVVALGVLGVMVLVSSGRLELDLDPATNSQLALIVLGVALAALGVTSVIARLRLEYVRRARLVSGGDLLSGMQGAAFALDFGLMRDILVERRWLNKGHVRPIPGRATGRATLVWREVDKLLRNPRGVLVLLASAIIPYALLSLGLGNLTPAITAIVLMFVMVPFFDSLRVVSRTRGLARAFPMSTSELNGSLTIVPAGLALVWALAASPAFVLIGQPEVSLDALGTGLAHGFVTAIAGYVAAIRWVSAKSADYSAPMVATGFGALPPGLAFNLVRGFDVIALITLPLLVGWSPLVSLAIAAICYLVLRGGGINTQEMMERNEEAKRELEAARAGRPAGASREKITYTRGQRNQTR
ncbi:MAG: DUF6297 family protein [Brooklawnia sp.]|uniref:DUF6297 family protein n=1 Tax=Brooklawnia sp. TaxID=2699740 RepID=UPI003C736887